VKGIILAGGKGTRLYPTTKVISKQLLPVYDKPMIYYPLSVLLLAGIKEILIISTPRDIVFFQNLLGDGRQLGVSFSYEVQSRPNGLAAAFTIGEKFIDQSDVCLILGDNIFYGERLPQIIKASIKDNAGATIFGYFVDDPSGYGVVEFDSKWRVLSVEEKPKKPKSNYAIPGLYLYDNEVVKIAQKIKPSKRGELEITAINKIYLKRDKLKVSILGRGFAWLDSGTIEDLQEAAEFIKIIERRQGLKIACLEEIAFSMGYINLKQLKKLAKPLAKSQYGQYLNNIIKRQNK